MKEIAPTSHILFSQRQRLHYLDWGNPDKPTLILQHGGLDHAHSWDWIARALRDDWHIIAPDLRGHGDSAWSPDGAYTMPSFVYDFAQLIHQLDDEPVSIVAHSLGGAIALRYTGLYPEKVRRIVAIEGMTPSFKTDGRADAATRWTKWIEERRGLSGRTVRRYATLEEALVRMKQQNRHLSDAQARHLTEYGVSRNEDGSYSWKFDNYLRSGEVVSVTDDELHAFWHAITCPTLLAYGRDSWASSPQEDGRARHFRNARVLSYENAGHWLHHDRFDTFVADLRAFLP